MHRIACLIAPLALLGLAPGCGDKPAPHAPAPTTRRLRPPPALENPRGIVGGPRDETAFEFDPEPATPADAPPLLDGIPALPATPLPSLAPYLQARRTRIAAVDTSRQAEPAAPAAPPALIVLTRLEDVTQVYRVDAPGGPFRQLTHGDDPIAQAMLVPGSPAQLLFRRDRDGDEAYQLIRRDLDTGRDQLLSDGTSRHGMFTVSREGRVAFTNNARAAGDMDVYVAPLRGPFAADRIVDRGGQWTAGAWSREGDRLLVRNYRAAARSSVFVATVATGQLEPLLPGDVNADADADAIARDARFSADGRKVYVIADTGGDIATLREVDLATGAVRALSGDIAWDVELVAVSPDGAQLAFVANVDGTSTLHVVDPATGERRAVPGLPRGIISTLNYAGPGQLAFTLATATEPADAYTYDLARGALARWSESESDVLERRPFVDPRLVRYPSFDGLAIPAYVYRPPGPGPFPVLLWIHGGPEEQHRPSFDPILQYFVVERGIAVIAPNIRGSSGYGRRYLGLDDGVRRADAIRDIGALLDWAARQPGLDMQRVGIFGGSYGGYVVLASLVEYGDRLAAGCDLVGISHFVRFLENTSEYRRDQRRAEYGDERDPAVRAYLHEISPLTNAARIRTPLLVGHGANDPRVPVQEAERIVAAARENGADVWFLLARDEGHGFRKQRSRDLFYSVMAAFFERYLLAAPEADDATADSPDPDGDGADTGGAP